MMADYIKREDAINAALEQLPVCFEKDAVESAWMELPAADVREVVRGRWLNGYRKQLCSICRYKGVRSWRFCPQCGAQMDADMREVDDDC